MARDTMTAGLDERAFAALPEAPAFVRDLRSAAFASFQAMPIPSQSTEEWRYTDLSTLDLDLAPATADAPQVGVDSLPPSIAAALGPIGRRAGLRVQHGASTIACSLDAAVAAQGVVFDDLDRAATAHPDLVEPHLHRLVPTNRTKFTALHGAFRLGGTFLYVPDGVHVELPLQALTYVDADRTAVFPHTLVVVGADAEVTLIDRLTSPDLGHALSVALTEIVVGPASRVRYVSLQEWGDGVVHLGVQRARLARDSELRTVAVGFGASLARAEAESLLAEQGATSEALGIFFADGDQHFDHRTEQDHIAPHCTSDLLYKGALRDRSRGVYSGWVHVRPGAQKTDAMQTSRNVILSDQAFARAIPNLEIEANDVRCGHAASVGPVEEEQLFYLMSRGIPRAEAERLIVFGFFNEVLERISVEEVRDSVTQSIERELSRDAG